MKNWRIFARTAGGLAGPIITVVWGAVSFVQEKRPMSPLEWIGLVLLCASIVYGVAELAIFLRGLHRKIETLRALDIDKRLTTMEGWWTNPENFDLFARRVLTSEKK